MQHRSLCELIWYDAPYSDITRAIDLSPTSVNETSDYGRKGRSVLHCAVDRKRWDVVELLVEKGADVNTASFSPGRTPLLLALTHCTDKNNPCDGRVFAKHTPMRILRLLRSEWNVNAVVTTCKDQTTTPLSFLIDNIMYKVFVEQKDIDHRAIASGRDVLQMKSPRIAVIDRQAPLEIIRCFATRENVQQYIDNNRYLAPLNDRWELILLYLSLGADIEQIRDRLTQEFKSKLAKKCETAPPFLREILTNNGRTFAPYEFLPQIYMTLNRQPMSLKLCAAVRAKKLVNSGLNVKPCEEQKQWLALELPACLADCMVNLTKSIEQWGEQTSSKLTPEEMDNISW